MNLLKFVLLFFIIFLMSNLKVFIMQKKKYLKINLQKNNDKDSKIKDNKEIKQYNKYLKIIDSFIIFLLTLLLFNVLFFRPSIYITNISMILYGIILGIAIITIFNIIVFNYRYDNNEKKSKICNIFYSINITIMIILTIAEFIIYLVQNN